MLNRLKLENFKAWRQSDLTFGKVTGFFGPNSAGKSSLLQFLLLLKQTRNATDRGVVLDFGGPEDLANLGTFADVVHHHDENRRIHWLLDWALPESLEINDPMNPEHVLASGDQLQMECSVGLQKKRLRAQELSYRLAETEFSLRPGATPEEPFELVVEGTDFDFMNRQGRPKQLPHPAKTYLFPKEVKSNYQNSDFLSDFELQYEKLMDSLYYLGPLRVYPRRQYHWGEVSPTDVGQGGERTMDAMLAATRNNLKRRKIPRGPGAKLYPFQEIVAYRLKKLGLIHDFRLEEIAKGTNLYRAMVKTSRSSAPTALTDVGFGVSQVLPALVLLYYVPEGSTVLMEQPEIHLHPAVQSGLADVMLNVASVRNVQIVVESHSEHLMRRLQRRVAEEEASSEDVKLYFVSSGQGQAYASDLLLNEWGEVENWPSNFFGDEMGEISAIAQSALARKMNQSS